MRPYSLDLREKIVESVKKGVPKAETARRFGVDRATVKRYCKQLDERGTLEPRKAPGKRSKLDEKAMRLLAKDLQQRPWATHSQRVEFLFALSGVSVSEATVCRAVGRLRRSRKKIQRGCRGARRVLEGTLAHGGLPPRSWVPGIRRRDGNPHLLGSCVCLRARRRASLLQDPKEPWQEHDAACEPLPRRIGAFDGCGRADHLPSVPDLRGALAGSCPAPRSSCGDGQPRGAPAEEGKGAHRRERLRVALSAVLLPGPQPDRGSPLEDQAHPKEDRSSHQGEPHRVDRSSVGSREPSRREGVLR